MSALATGFGVRVAVRGAVAASFGACSFAASWASRSSILAAACLAARTASRLRARSVATVRSSFSTCARNSSLLIFGPGEVGRSAPGPSIAIEVVGAGGLWPTLVDPPQLENALLNLCINARDAMPEAGG